LNLAIKDFSDEATRTATNRINNFENLLIEKMTKVEDALTAFADPSFQVLLLEAQRTAAASEREFDFELLSQLMLDRFQRGQNKLIRTG
ncbi:LPO_1073/Vpar_1526 family protein, partial [Propionibacterium freudenreichii]